jgi:16S rRNA (guanine527-N7)-methyltransferase
MSIDATLIFEHFPDLTEVQRKQFAMLGDLYAEWNAQINVISRKDFEHFYERHVLHSLGIAKVIHFKPGTHVLDVGTGGGFPGIPLAILFPETRFLLVDSIGKKIMVVDEVIAALGLENAAAIQERAEEIDETFDFVVSRAVTKLEKFIPWVSKSFNKKSKNSVANGILYLKGGDLHEELNTAPIKHNPTLHNLPDFFEGEFFETKKVVYIPMV